MNIMRWDMMDSGKKVQGNYSQVGNSSIKSKESTGLSKAKNTRRTKWMSKILRSLRLKTK